MSTKKKYRKTRGHYYDWGAVLEFVKDNPEVAKMATSMMSQQQGGAQPQQALPQIDRGVTGQKTIWQGDSNVPFSNAAASIANAIGSFSKKGTKPVEEVIGLPGNYYDFGGVMGAVNTGADLFANAAQLAKGVDTEQYEKKVNNYGNQEVAANNNEELLRAFSENNYLNHIDKYDITGGNLTSDILGGINSNIVDASKGAIAGFKASKNWVGALVGGIIGGVGNAYGQIKGAINTKKNLERLNNSIDVANYNRQYALNSAKNRIVQNQKANLLANYSAYGGPIFGMPVMGPASYDIAKDNAYAKQLQAESKDSSSFTPIFGSPSYEFSDGGGIHIAPSKKGTFTAAAKKHGKSVQAFASQVLANPDNYSPAMRKKANFARNAAKWHDEGGFLLSNQFTNGVTLVDQGGTHERNPHEGVQMGIAPDGKPNLVEQGEAIFNDYVFSNRLKVPKEVRNKYKLRGPKDMTFAEAFRETQKESEERPNDPISKNGLENMAMILARTQEAVRNYKQNHKKAKGGHLFSDGATIDWDSYNYDIDDPNVSEPEVDAATDAFWQDVLGDSWNSKRARKAYMNASDSSNNMAGALRYVEPLVNAGAVISDALGFTNNPYTYDYIPAFQAARYTPLGNYLPVTHFDTRYAANMAAQQAAATRNAIMQSTAPSRNAALLAADYNAQIANGELLRQAAMDDYNMMVKREEFNRATNQVNSDMGLRASLANQDARLRYAQAALQQAKMNVDETNMTKAAKAANISALAESIGGIGRESDARAWRDMLLRAGFSGTLSEKPNDWSDEQWYAYQQALRGNHSSAKGGKIKKKRGLTY